MQDFFVDNLKKILPEVKTQHKYGNDFEYQDVKDKKWESLSYIGRAAYNCLHKKHKNTQGAGVVTKDSRKGQPKCWNVTSGKVVRAAIQTPAGTWESPVDPPQPHDLFLPQNMAAIMSSTQYWLDVTQLAPPDGEFLVQLKQALVKIAETANQPGHNVITIRLLFGNIVGMPVNIDSVMHQLTEDIPEGSNIQLWVGAWRKGVSWNHSKVIAVDGRYLHNGGHNLWDQHYLQNNPVHDLSMQAEGECAIDGHLFANFMWGFIEKIQTGYDGQVIAMMSDKIPLPYTNRVTVSEYPEDEVGEFPLEYEKDYTPRWPPVEGAVPMITMGRYGALLAEARPSDDAFIQMFRSAKQTIKMSLQDIGPITIPGTAGSVTGVVAVPGCAWPKHYLREFGRALVRGLTIEIALSTPGSCPGGMGPTEALYGNGWTCDDVASEIIKTLTHDDPDITDEMMMKHAKQLKLCYLKQAQSNQWNDGLTMGNHAKHFIIDERAYYLGSQNLYVCDLAEWGVLVDNEPQTKQMMKEYWNPMWKASWTSGDCDLVKVISPESIEKDRDGAEPSAKHAKQVKEGHAAAAKHPGKDDFHDNDERELDNHASFEWLHYFGRGQKAEE